MDETEILLIEDHEAMRERITRQIEAAAEETDSSARLTVIDESNANTLVGAGDISNEMALAEGIRGQYPNAALIVVDHDLSNLKNPAISESSITAAAHTLAIPVCRYHRQPSGASLRIDALWELNARVYSIDLEAPSEAENENHRFGTEVLNILEGFKQIASGYQALEEPVRKKGAPAVLSHILDKPALEDFFAAYSEGIPFLNDMLIVRKLMEESPQEGAERVSRPAPDNLNRRIPYMLGYWLHNFILRFPGLILNEVAAASYLDIDTEDFKKEAVLRCFDEARYEGPFSRGRKYWWRPLLDDLLIEQGGRDEILQAEDLDPQSVGRSKSHASGKSPAGYYDIFSGLPISKEDSIGSLSWIPSGADLARVDRNLYEEIAPILGI
ncbi:MAG TPA: hypothetical protein ENJ79_00450 [Gammaproteobacteria bacterium]|nr:hypothetical protein [Gammaproteobacteria bacterium]